MGPPGARHTPNSNTPTVPLTHSNGLATRFVIIVIVIIVIIIAVIIKTNQGNASLG